MLHERERPAPPAPLDLDWQLFAACSELDVEESDRLFFCGQGQARLANQAREICAVCIVRAECLAFALENPKASEYGIWGGLSPSEYGIWGGLSPSQRRKLRGLSR